MNHRRGATASCWITAAFVSLMFSPTSIFAEDVRSIDHNLGDGANLEAEIATQLRNNVPTQSGLRLDSSGHEQRISHNPLAEDFNFYDQTGAPDRTVESNQYRASASSTQTRGADGGFPEWMAGGTYPWFIGSFSAPNTALPPGSAPRAPSCDYLGRSDPWVVPGTAVRYLGCEVRNMNTGAKERHHYDHCQIDSMAHNSQPPTTQSFMPSTSGIKGWSPRSNRSLCPAPSWSMGSYGGGSWSGSSSGCGGTYTQTKTETRSVTCITNGASPDNFCTQNGLSKPSTTRTVSRTVNEPACPEPDPVEDTDSDPVNWTVGTWGDWQGTADCGTGKYQQTRTRNVTCPSGNCVSTKPTNSETRMVDQQACVPAEEPPVANPTPRVCTPGATRQTVVSTGCMGYLPSGRIRTDQCNAAGSAWELQGYQVVAGQHTPGKNPCANGK